MNMRAFWLGYAFVPTMELFTDESYNENHIWQQFLWTGKTFLGKFTSRSRFEERFLNQPDVAYRFRQQFKLSYPLDFAPGFRLVGSDEYFVNLNTTGMIDSGIKIGHLPESAIISTNTSRWKSVI
jgi:hypothetical protein